MQANLINGWREVLARIFDGFETEYGVSPEWLINPETNRRLKLDLLFPAVSVAIRFIGLAGTQRRSRKSDEEVILEAERERWRAEICRKNGVVLVSIDPDGEPRVALRSLETGLARAAASLAQSAAVSHAAKQKLMPQLSLARRRAGEFTIKLNPPEKLNIYAEMWWDRQANLSTQAAAQPKRPAGPRPSYRVGMEVEHTHFGPGAITAVEPEDGDMKITVDFPGAGVRSFLASIVADKLQIA